MRVAITGASGFVGRTLAAALSRNAYQVAAIVRRPHTVLPEAENHVIPDLLDCELEPLLQGVDIVINCSAVTSGKARSPTADQEINAKFPARLARAAKAVGAQRFVQLSSVAAITSSTQAQETITDDAEHRPTTPYGRSKLAADIALDGISSKQMPVISLRPPMIFGPGGAGPFALFARCARLGAPLPIGAIENRRSIAFVGNVASAVVAACRSDAAGAFIVTDSPPISTAHLYRELLHAYGHSDRVFRFPEPIINGVARMLLGRRAESLLGNAAYDGGRFNATVGWTPPIAQGAAIAQTITPDQAAPPTCATAIADSSVHGENV